MRQGKKKKPVWPTKTVKFTKDSEETRRLNADMDELTNEEIRRQNQRDDVYRSNR